MVEGPGVAVPRPSSPPACGAGPPAAVPPSEGLCRPFPGLASPWCGTRSDKSPATPSLGPVVVFVIGPPDISRFPIDHFTSIAPRP